MISKTSRKEIFDIFLSSAIRNIRKQETTEIDSFLGMLKL